MRALTLFTSLALLFAPGALAADAPTHRAELLAWSTDGRTALIRETSTTPNGGGERALRLVSRTAPKRILVSQITNPAAKRPQKISDSSCLQRLKSLSRALTKRGFTDVSVAETCADRAKLVTLGHAARARAQDSWFRGTGTRLSKQALTLTLSDNVMEVTASGKRVGQWSHTPQPLEMKAALSPSHELLVVIHTWGHGNSGLLKVLASKSGLPEDLRALRL